MSYIFHTAHATGDRTIINHAHITYNLFNKLVMWRTQLIDSETLLFKFGHPENITVRVNIELKSIPIEFFH